MAHAPDERLVRQAQKGNKAAFAELFTQYEGRIFGYLYRMVGDRAWAEDLAQEAFIQAHQHLGRLGPPYDFKSWIYRIAGNLALDGLRRHRYTMPLPDWDGGEATMLEPVDEHREGAPEEQAHLAEVRAAVWRVLHQLPENYRQILVLREIDGLSYNEIATVLGTSLDNVRITLHRARLRFRDAYGLQVMMREGRAACQQLDDLLSAYVDGELDRSTRKQVKAHVAACPACQKKRRDLLAVSGLVAALVPVFPPTTLHSRFLTRLQHLPPPEVVPAATSGSPIGRGGGGFLERGPVPWLFAITGGGAILIAGAIILGLLILSGKGTFPLLATDQPTSTPSVSPTNTPTTTVTPSATPTQTCTPTRVPPTPTRTPIPPTPTPRPTFTPTPLPTFTPTPLPTPTPEIAFWADNTTVPAGSCTTIHWDTEHVQAVSFDGSGVPGTGSHQTCPCVDESHTLDVTLLNGSHDVRHLTIQVSGSCITPTPDTQGPPAPSPDSPTGDEGLSCRRQVPLSWGAVKDPSGVAGYYIRLERRLNGKTQLVGDWGPFTKTEVPVRVICGYKYRWAVRARDGGGYYGPWSAWALFGIGID